MEMHPTDPNTLYAAMWRAERKPWTIISGMEASGREDGIWRSRDGGDTWTYMDVGLPTGLIGKIDLAVSVDDPDRVYALVETKEPEEGLYRSDDAGTTWRMVTNHKPLLDRPFYYTNIDADPTDADVVYVNATQFWKSTDGGTTFERRSTPHGDNHDMWINPIDPLVTSSTGGYQGEEFPGIGPEERGRATEPRVGTTAGMHRFLWDLRYPGGLAGRGPLAIPDRYEVRLTADGLSQTRSLEVLIDPRVAEDNVTLADMQEQFSLNIRIRDALIRGRLAVRDIASAKEDMEAGGQAGRDAAARAMAALEELAEVEAALVSRTDGSYQTPMLVDQLSYLYGMTSRADQRPGADAYERLQVLEDELERHIETLQRIMRTPIAEDLP